MKKRIAIDMDDTIAHLVSHVLDIYNEQYPSHSISYDQAKDWNFEGLAHPDASIDAIYEDGDLYRMLRIYDEYVAQEMEKIHEDYDLIIVTAAFPQAALSKWEWLQEHCPFIPFSNFFIAQRKDLIEADLLIDDHPKNILPWIEKNRHAIAIKHPWNQELPDHPNLSIVHSWKGMKNLIDTILRKEN